MVSFWTAFPCLLAWISSTSALTAFNGSTCYTDLANCGHNDTVDSDLVCSDAAYKNTPQGKRMKQCILCESNPTPDGSPTNNNNYYLLCTCNLSLFVFFLTKKVLLCNFEWSRWLICRVTYTTSPTYYTDSQRKIYHTELPYICWWRQARRSLEGLRHFVQSRERSFGTAMGRCWEGLQLLHI